MDQISTLININILGTKKISNKRNKWYVRTKTQK
jgi:hypothetical protein